MTTSLSKENSKSNVEYRAKCNDCRFKGNWTTNKEKATTEANQHMSEPDNETHITKVISKQRNN